MKVFLISIVLFFALNSYYGYDGDASLYLLQTVNFLHPERFAGDPQFIFGNQGGFSLFNPLCALIFKLFSVNAGGVAFTIFFQLNICVALVIFIKKFLLSLSSNSKTLTLAVGVAIVLYSQATYGCDENFEMAVFESFLVARLASQVLILWGLVFFFDKKNIALLFFLLSVAMHPLTGGWAILFWILFYYPKCCAPVLFVALLFPLSGFLHIGKFDFIYKDWLVRPLYMLPNVNRWFDCMSVLTVFVLLAVKFKDSLLKRVSVCLSVVAFIAIYWQLIAASAEHVFLYQLQPFRFMWFGIIMLLPLVWIFFREQVKTSDFDNWIVLAIVLTLSIQVISIHQSISVPFLAFALFAVGDKLVPERFFQHVCCSMILLLVVVITIFNYANDFKSFSFVYSFFKYTTLLDVVPLLKKNVFMLCILMFLFMLRQRKWFLATAFLICSCFENAELLQVSVLAIMYNKHLSSFLYLLLYKRGAWIVAFVLLSAYAVLFWDSRNDYRRGIESNMSHYLDNSLFPQIIDRGKIFYFVCNEGPISSRFRFLTGGYIDKAIHIGEAFFYEQYKETTRRKNLFVLRKDSFDPIKPSVFEEKFNRIHDDLDSLNDRIGLLCDRNEIMYVVTDRKELVGQTIDSVYIEERKKIFLKKCR